MNDRANLPDNEDYVDPFEQALGVYVGEATRTEIVDAIAGHNIPGASFVARLTSPSGELIWHKALGSLTEHISGWTDTTLSDSGGAEVDEKRTDVLVFGGEDAAHFPAWTVWTEVPLVLDLDAGHIPQRLERFSGGVRLTFSGSKLTLVFWNGVLYETESGDLAPGFGPFSAGVEEVGVDDLPPDHGGFSSSAEPDEEDESDE